MPDSSEPLDPLIHASGRLALVSALHECERADFNFLLAATGLTRGNLSVHMAKLVEAGYVAEHKHFVDRKPRTDYRLTRTGSAAFGRYKKAWKKLTGS